MAEFDFEKDGIGALQKMLQQRTNIVTSAKEIDDRHSYFVEGKELPDDVFMFAPPPDDPSRCNFRNGTLIITALEDGEKLYLTFNMNALLKNIIRSYDESVYDNWVFEVPGGNKIEKIEYIGKIFDIMVYSIFERYSCYGEDNIKNAHIVFEENAKKHYESAIMNKLKNIERLKRANIKNYSYSEIKKELENRSYEEELKQHALYCDVDNMKDIKDFNLKVYEIWITAIVKIMCKDYIGSIINSSIDAGSYLLPDKKPKRGICWICRKESDSITREHVIMQGITRLNESELVSKEGNITTGKTCKNCNAKYGKIEESALLKDFIHVKENNSPSEVDKNDLEECIKKILICIYCLLTDGDLNYKNIEVRTPSLNSIQDLNLIQTAWQILPVRFRSEIKYANNENIIIDVFNNVECKDVIIQIKIFGVEYIQGMVSYEICDE